MKILLALMIIIPAIEIGLLIVSGKMLGVLPTVLLIIATGALGAWLAKQQGLETLRKAQEELRYGRIPAEAILDGLCILIGGIFLLTPGFVSDLTGFFLLLPPTRKVIKPLIIKMLKRMINKGHFTIFKY
jgi:UPF0716 protein FxsA